MKIHQTCYSIGTVCLLTVYSMLRIDRQHHSGGRGLVLTDQLERLA